jgi:UDP-N-acetylmuramyl pentapeptide phosphotransferase/UDP-N-acetylglucosamine-1-phosphate transferase
MNWSSAGVLFICVFAASLAATRGVLAIVQRHAILDLPNERSSHTVPTPKGGGIAVVAILIPVWYWLAAPAGGQAALVLSAAAGGLALLSWVDDLKDIQASWRLLGQAVAVSLVFALAPPPPLFGGALPPTVDLLVAGVLWLWFINVFNFMDGIDGLAASETITIGAGITLLAAVAGLGWVLAAQGLAAAAAGLGFLWWNRPPARIFMGDVGSVTLGFLLGWLLLEVARSGLGAAALILPLYFLADATVTLIRRALRLQPVWRAHREHFYQRAIDAGASHGNVVTKVLFVNFLLIGLAALAAKGLAVWAIGGAALLVGFLLRRLGRKPTVAP